MREEQKTQVEKVLAELAVSTKPVIQVLNKVDLVAPQELAHLSGDREAIPVSSLQHRESTRQKSQLWRNDHKKMRPYSTEHEQCSNYCYIAVADSVICALLQVFFALSIVGRSAEVSNRPVTHELVGSVAGRRARAGQS